MDGLQHGRRSALPPTALSSSRRRPPFTDTAASNPQCFRLAWRHQVLHHRIPLLERRDEVQHGRFGTGIPRLNCFVARVLHTQTKPTDTCEESIEADWQRVWVDLNITCQAPDSHQMAEPVHGELLRRTRLDNGLVAL